MTLDRGLVLITGASGGIGKSTAMFLAEKGYRVAATSRARERLADLETEATRRGLPVYGVELDLNSEDGLTETLAEVTDEHGPIDSLVNNAGYGLWGPVQTLSMDELRAQFETNFFAGIRLIQSVAPGMVERRRGTIVNVSSIAGRIGIPFNGAYAASKFAIEGLSESLRLELWPLGVRVALVEPGLFQTSFLDNQVIASGIGSENGEPYRGYIERYRNRNRGVFSGKDPVRVARVIHKIIRSRRPRFRYPVGPEAWLGSWGAKLVPERLFQSLVSRASIGR